MTRRKNLTRHADHGNTGIVSKIASVSPVVAVAVPVAAHEVAAVVAAAPEDGEGVAGVRRGTGMRKMRIV